MRKFSPLVALLVLTLTISVVQAQAIDVTTALYYSNLQITNTDAAATGEIVDFPFSGYSLADQNFIAADGLNSVVVSNLETQVPAQPASTRTALEAGIQEDAAPPAFTSYTTEINNATADDVIWWPASPAVDDAFYFGFYSPGRILTLSIGTAANFSATFAWEYYDGSSWVALPNVVDNTDNLQVAGQQQVSWDMPFDWAETTVNSVTSYFVRIRISAFTSATTIGAGNQGFWESGVWIVNVDSIGENSQLNYRLYLGGSTDLSEYHYMFPGDAGIVTSDDASIELGSDYLLRTTAWVKVDGTTTTRDIVNKASAVRIHNPASGTIRATLNGVTNLDVTGVTEGEYVIELSDDGTTTTFTVYGVGSSSTASVTITDNANDWEWGTEGAVNYFGEILIGFPVQQSVSTTAEWNARTNSDTTGSSNQLVLSSADAWQTTCNGLQTTPTDWTAICASSTGLGWELGSALGIGAAEDGVNVYGLASSGSNNTEFSVYAQVAGTPGLDYSFAAWCWRAETPVVVLRIEFLDSSFVQLSTDDDTASTCNAGSWNEWAVNASTAPANTAWVRFHLMSNTTTSSTTKGKDVYWDNARACEDCSAAPVLQSASNNLIGNGSFESVQSTSGTSTSTAFDPTSITNVASTGVLWSDTIAAGESATYEVSTDDGSNWTEVTTSGDPIPGVSAGDDLSGASNYRTRITLTGPGTTTPEVDFIIIFVLGVGGNGLYYQLNTLPSLTIEDQTNSNDGTYSYPLHSNSFISESAGPLLSTSLTDTITSDVVTPGIVDEINPGDITDYQILNNDIPLNALWQALSDITAGPSGNAVPPIMFWAIIATIIVLGSGSYTFMFTGSVAWTAAVMGMFVLGFVNFGGGLFPFWIFFFFAVMAMAASTLQKVKAM